MTCIVGLIQDGTVYIGGDSRIVCGWQTTTAGESTAKVFRLGDMLIGVAGSMRIDQVIRYAFVPPEHPDGMDPIAYLVGPLATAMRECLRANACIKSESGTDIMKADDNETSLLIAYRGRLFRFCSNQAVLEPPLGYDAIGGGSDFAYGSLHTSDVLSHGALGRIDARKRIDLALTAAAQFNMGVGAPFVIEELTP